jgi:hypothetical protein
MDTVLKRAVGPVQLLRVEAVAPRQSKQREVVQREVDQTLKLSPQPH